MSADEQLLDALRDHGCDVKETGQGKAIAQCPAHDDRNPSLSITKTAGRTLLYCHAGCETVDVLAAINRTMADLYDEPFTHPKHGQVYARYNYPGGRVVLRTADKQFPQPGNNADRSLYHADRIGDAKTVYFVEGEEDVHAVEAAGRAAVCSAMGAGKAKHADLTPLTGKNVVVVADKDTPGRKHAAQVAELLDGIAASVRIVEAAVGKDAADHIAAGKTLNELVAVEQPSLLDQRARIGAVDGAELVQLITLDAARKVFQKWLGDDYDTDALDAMLAAVAVEKFDDGSDLIWLLLISGPGNAKTETVQALDGIKATVTSAISSEAALLSGTSKRERVKDATGGLLRKIGGRGVLVIKDVTSVLAMDRNMRAKVLAALREIYDGRWYREVGVDGGRTIEWRGRIAVIGAVTTAWDTAHGVIATMGDRFVLVRIDSTKGRLAAGRKAIGNTGSETEMRAELADAVAGVIAGMNPEPITVTDDETRVLLEAADLVTLARTGVEYDYRGDVIDAHAPEMPTRFAKQLAQIVRGAVAIGMNRAEALRLAIRCARDSMPPLRLAIIDNLAEYPHSTPTDVRKRLGKPRATVDRQLQALHMLGVLTLEEEVEGGDQDDQDDAYGYRQDGRRGRQYTRWYYSLSEDISPDAIKPETLPDLLVDTPKPKKEGEGQRQEDEDVVTNISGNVSGSSGESAARQASHKYGPSLVNNHRNPQCPCGRPSPVDSGTGLCQWCTLKASKRDAS